MKRLVIIPLALFKGGNSIHNNQQVLKITRLAEILKEEFKEYLPQENSSSGKEKTGTSFKEIRICCSESFSSRETVEIFENVLGVKATPHQELCSTGGRVFSLKNLHSLVTMERSEVLFLITDEKYYESYPNYFSIMNKYPKAIGKITMESGQALIVYNDKTTKGYGSTTLIAPQVEEPASAMA